MTRDEKYIARIIIKNKFYEADKQSFENIFTKIKQHENAGFKQIKPQGRLGDGKCDGFNPHDGTYYQVYAPEELTGNESTLLTKMDATITGLIDFWNEKGFEVKKYCYVVKDNYQNVYALIYTNAEAIATKFNIKCEVLTCKDVEDSFMQLEEDKIIDIIGMIPDPLNVNSVDYSVMDEVIKHIIKSEMKSSGYSIPADPNFDNKIVFNKLSRAVSDFLNAGFRQNFVIKDYFELNSKFVKDELRQVFNSFYNEGLKIIPDSETKNDEVFQFIVEKSSPNNTLSVSNAVYILMSYYFETCDIFETPIV